MQWNRWFANSDVPFQSVTNNLLHGQFAMQTYALHQGDVTSELLHSWWFAHVRNINKTIKLWLFGLVFYLYQLDRKLVHTNPILHAEPCINYYMLLLYYCLCCFTILSRRSYQGRYPLVRNRWLVILSHTDTCHWTGHGKLCLVNLITGELHVGLINSFNVVHLTEVCVLCGHLYVVTTKTWMISFFWRP